MGKKLQLFVFHCVPNVRVLFYHQYIEINMITNKLYCHYDLYISYVSLATFCLIIQDYINEAYLLQNINIT